MRIVSWNVARGRSRLAEQAAVLALREPDVVALQEITARTVPLWRKALATPWVESCAGVPGLRRPGARASDAATHGVLLASRNLLSGTTAKLGLPWSENAISGTTAADSYRVEVLCVHVPNAANGWVKVETLQAIRTSLASAPPGPPGIARKREHFPTGKLPAWDVQVSAENSGTPKAGSRKRVGCGRTRSSGPSGTRLPRRFPSPERLCQTGTQLDVAAHRWP